MVPGHAIAQLSDEERCVWDPQIPLHGPLGIVTAKESQTFSAALDTSRYDLGILVTSDDQRLVSNCYYCYWG